MKRGSRLWSVALRAMTVAALFMTPVGLSSPTAFADRADGLDSRSQPSPAASCQLGVGHGNSGGDIQHVIYVQFDNTHFNRDRQNVPSDLEQMPHLLNFMRDNGTLLTNDHTILISHTAAGFLSSFTGLNPDHTGQGVSNSYRYFTGTGSTGTNSASSFKYWTDLVDDTGTPPADPSYNMVTDGGKNTPAPWVSYTRAGCDFGAVGSANIVLENTGTGPHGDITSAFGANSTDWNAVKNGTLNATQASAAYVGLAIHCAASGGICSQPANAPGAQNDVLPDEPGTYSGFKALFGGKYVDPAITGQPYATPTKDILGHDITDPSGNPGFPGFDALTAARSLGLVAQMQEAGVPVTYAYISDAHDAHPSPDPTGNHAYGPGEVDYQAQLQAYDQAFAAFFDRLANHGITKQNTLFVFTVDEGDHFDGGNSPDGTWSHTFCNVSIPNPTCPSNQIGEVTANINGLLPADPSRPIFTIHSDSAPNFWVVDPTTKARLGRTDASLRKLERDVAAAQAVDPYIRTDQKGPVMAAMADTVGERLLHMGSSDAQRIPSFTMFANPDFFVISSAAGTVACPDTAHAVPVCVDYHFAWNHGDSQHEIANTWLGMVGPGVQRGGIDSQTWTDHTDVRPTMMSLLSLQDDYRHDGRVLIDVVEPNALPQTLHAHHETVVRLGEGYKQINAPFGQLGQDALLISTAAVSSGNSSSDTQYADLESQLEGFNTRRDAIAGQMLALLDAAEFKGQQLNEQQAKGLIDQAQSLLQDIHALAGGH